MALRVFLPCQPAGRTEFVFFALDKRASAASAMLWLDSLELRAFITVFTEGAAFDFIPIRTQQPLPVWIIVNVVDALAEH